MKAQRTYTVVSRVPDALAPLRDLTDDLGRLHDPRVRALFREIDPDAVDLDGLDPVGVLARAPEARLEELAADPGFVTRATEVRDTVHADRDRTPWFSERADSPLRRVAYLSPEYGLAASLPQYSGGLGVLAGDHLKAADDLGVPLVGVGLFYRHGYFRQQLDDASRQQERFPRLSPATMTLEQVDDLRVTVELAGVEVRAAIWHARVGGVSLYLLDSEVDGNEAPDQLVTDRLYGGGTEQRIRQELLLGVGGYRALRALGLDADVFHLNEGHAGFLALERVRVAMEDGGLDYDAAVESVREGMVFTTHTPVPAGIDRFPRELIEDYLGWWCTATGRSVDQLMELGLEPDGDLETFNLAAMCLRLCGSANGVSQLHGAVSRTMFSELWPKLPTDEVPIGSVTNGVHGRTWVGDGMSALLRDTVGPGWQAADAATWAAVHEIPHERLWAARSVAREQLIAFTRRRVRNATIRRRRRASAAAWCDSILDPDALTIGFARRFATYKRSTLLFRDPDRLVRLVSDPARPVQLLFAGKAHPADEPGKELLRTVASAAGDPDLRDRIVFVEDYDIDVGRALTEGCDVWLNTPVRPNEACGTSGMKAALNGALNCSVLDGWWDEWYEPELGWAIPSSDWIEDADERDDAESEWVFDLLERRIVPLFFDRDERGLPVAWLDRVKRSLATLGPKVSAQRMVAEYVERYYEPAAARGRSLIADGAGRAVALATWRDRVAAAWDDVAVVDVAADEHDPSLGDALEVTAHVALGPLDPSEVSVQVVHGPVDPGGELLSVTVGTLGHVGEGVWRGSVPCDRGGSYGFAVRAVPQHPDLASWLDLGLVAWGDWPS